MMNVVARILAGLMLLGLTGPGFAGAAQAQEQASSYLDAVEDMPLMEGLSETGEGGIVFDKPNGRIVRSIAQGRVTATKVRFFYTDTLPQLGWVRLKKLELIDDLLIFERETERLEIEIVPQSDGLLQVRFSIEPK